MCGIAGIVHWDKTPVSAAELSAMAAVLRHRGPDEQNAVLPSEGVGLSHCRLRVIDLSIAARQPMAAESGRVWLLFNGEIYNFKELQQELICAGVSFRSRSDTEVILRAYERWGTQAIRRLDGMFALGLWDAQEGRLVLARDRTGKKPLFYWTDGNCLAFASEIKALFVHPHVPRRLEERVLGPLLLYGHPPGGKSCYQQIRQVPPAAFLTFKGNQTEPVTQEYWKLSLGRTASRVTSEEACGQLNELLTNAVRRRLVADVPLGAFLSGGIDSTLVVGLMSRLIPHRPVKTFSIGFPDDPRFDETRFSELAARHFHTEHTPFLLSPPSFDLVEKLVWHTDQPFGDSSAVPTYLLSELARSQVTVALSGDGGDELFAGYDRFRAALLAESIPRGIRRVGHRLLGRGRLFSAAPSRSVWGRIGKFFEASHEPLPQRCRLWAGFFTNPERIVLRSNSEMEQGLETNGSAEHPSASRLSQLLAANFKEYLPNDLHVKTDRCSMAHGLEVRSPFLDTALIEWAFQLPDSFKLRGRQSKWIVRRAFRNLLPPEILGRGKRGFGVPLGAWFRQCWREPLTDLLLPSSSRVYRFLHRESVKSLVENHLGGQQENGQLLWLLLTLEIWLRQLENPVSLAPSLKNG